MIPHKVNEKKIENKRRQVHKLSISFSRKVSHFKSSLL